MDSIHTPVLLDKVMEFLKPKPGYKIIDATLDGGGHARDIFEKIMPGGKLLGIELDEILYNEALKIFNKEPYVGNFTAVNGSYVNIESIARKNGFWGADGIVFDLGMSSWHLGESGKGFSFSGLEPLDMRYAGKGITAAEILNNYSRGNLEFIIKEYGGERFAKSIASEIEKKRKEKSFENTLELVETIKNGVPFWYRTGRRTHFATKTFQALRIEANNELKNIEKGFPSALNVLKSVGRIAAITFHSLEDKTVKNIFKKWEKEERGIIITKKPIKPSFGELKENRKSRSAKLRIFEKS